MPNARIWLIRQLREGIIDDARRSHCSSLANYLARNEDGLASDAPLPDRSDALADWLLRASNTGPYTSPSWTRTFGQVVACALLERSLPGWDEAEDDAAPLDLREMLDGPDADLLSRSFDLARRWREARRTNGTR